MQKLEEQLVHEENSKLARIIATSIDINSNPNFMHLVMLDQIQKQQEAEEIKEDVKDHFFKDIQDPTRLAAVFERMNIAKKSKLKVQLKF